jgi:hypothetical protein
MEKPMKNKEGRMKKIRSCLAILAILLGFASLSEADTVINGNVNFWAIDADSDKSIQLSYKNVSISPLITFQYSYDNIIWSDFASDEGILPLSNVNDGQHIYLRLEMGNNPYKTDGSMHFMGEDTANKLYNSLLVDWGIPNLTLELGFYTPSNGDKLSPTAAPIPGAGLLLSSGLIGIVAIRRRQRN